MKYLIVIPARGGSKGIPLKNIYPLCNKPLIEYTIEAALQANIHEDICVSSDSDIILKTIEKYPDVIQIKRPEEISNDTASTEATLLHAVDFMKEHYQKVYDGVITLQPTSPLRTSSLIRSFVDEFEKVMDLYDAQLTLTETYSDHWIMNEYGTFQRLYPDAPRRRQERKPLYIENSAIYLTKTEVLQENRSVLGKKPHGYPVSEVEGLDINEMKDIYYAEFLLNKILKQS